VANVKLVEEADAPDKTRAIYGDIKKTFGVLPALFKAMGNNPEVLEAAWSREKAIMTQGKLDRKTKELIALAVSATNACRYCIDAHTAMLKRMGVTDDEIVEAVAVADLFNGFNALADGLQIESDLKP
jgi:AhpD family alkylhydroperoxidase